jgi:hypothetical protein
MLEVTATQPREGALQEGVELVLDETRRIDRGARWGCRPIL